MERRRKTRVNTTKTNFNRPISQLNALHSFRETFEPINIKVTAKQKKIKMGSIHKRGKLKKYSANQWNNGGEIEPKVILADR